MHKKSIITLFVLVAAIWGSVCFVSMRTWWLFKRQEQLFADAKIRSITIETKSIADLLAYLKCSNTLVIWDIDNTLAAPKGLVGSDQFTTYLLDQYIEQGMSLQEAYDEVLPIVFDTVRLVQMVPLEKDTLKVLRYLKTNHIPSIALTSRSIEIADRTIEQLAGAGIVLQAPEQFNHEVYTVFEAPALYKDNIIFCAKNDKGKVLMYIFKKFNYMPDYIIYIDDKVSYILAVEKECLKNNIHFIGIRYGFTDERVKQFDPVAAQKEYEQLVGSPLPIPGFAH